MTTSPTRPEPTVLAPTDLRSAHEALADSAGAVRIAGAGTAADWAGTPQESAAVLDTTGMTGVLAYNPGDMTVSVRAGMPLRELQAELAGHGQRLAFDPARGARGATVGGLTATADSGPLALAYGSLRDLVIGVTMVLADGTVARNGGHVIKNVAGYDLAKLLHGSYGGLGLLAEVVLRLHPLPSSTRTVRLACALDAAAGHSAAVMASALEPVAVEWYGATPQDGALLVRLEGTDEGTRVRATTLAELLGTGATLLSDDEAATEWERHTTAVESRDTEGAVLRLGCRPSRLAGVLGELASGGGCSALTAGLATGIGTATLPAEAAAVDAAHRAVAAAGGGSVLRHRGTSSGLAAWGHAPSAVKVLAAVKKELDPQGRLGPGRFESWFTEADPQPSAMIKEMK
jgi:glycolate oxidase FAD binding subunit